MTQLCSNPHCRRTSPGDGPTCRWHIRNCGTELQPDNGKYCPFCIQIYREKDPDSFDGKVWMGCDNRNCRRWVHVDCESATGFRVDSTKLYLCPHCRENKTEMGDRKKGGRYNFAAERTSDESSASMTVQEEAEVKKLTKLDGKGSETKLKVEVKRMVESPRRRMKRPPRVDMKKLEVSSLERYKEVYNLEDVTTTCKEELAIAVASHFAEQVVDEDEIIMSFFIYSLRKQRAPSGSSSAALARSAAA
eukprot:SM000314S12178  [mRNA]  locus=s314:28337:30941:+ [translate_table: standard]